MIASSPAVWAVVLAAGASSRMGELKLALPWGATTVLGQVLAQVGASPVAGTVVVTGSRAEGLAAVLAAHDVQVVHNPRWSGGMITSLQVGLGALPPVAAVALVVLGDMPALSSITMATVIADHLAGGADAVVPVFRGQRGHPVALGRRAMSVCLELPAGRAPRNALADPRLTVRYLDVADPGILRDVDDRAGYEAALAGLRP